MKLIVTGATGFVGKEIIRQSLLRSDITSIVALARSPIPEADKLSSGADSSKLKSVVIKDYDVYTDDVRKELSGAAACIWTVAITPSKSSTYEFDEVKRVCQTSTLEGMRAIHGAGPVSPFRFLYMSGIAAERDQTKTPKRLAQYCLMRGETENQVLALAKELGGMEAAAVKPGYITKPGEFARSAMAAMLRVTVGVPSIDVADLVAVMLDQVVNGFEKDPLTSDDLVRLSEALPKPE
ncbi:NAD(P)-binding protein [Nemania sp. FL0916]|nr:NAD(P)-binding protein [Nemania sp. FL0916]